MTWSCLQRVLTEQYRDEHGPCARMTQRIRWAPTLFSSTNERQIEIKNRQVKYLTEKRKRGKRGWRTAALSNLNRRDAGHAEAEIELQISNFHLKIKRQQSACYGLDPQVNATASFCQRNVSYLVGRSNVELIMAIVLRRCGHWMLSLSGTSNFTDLRTLRNSGRK